MMDKYELYLVSLSECNACEEVKERLKDEEVKRKLKEKYGTSDVKIVYLDRVAESKEDSIAAHICYSLDSFSAPKLVVKKRNRICELDERLEEVKCALLRKMPSS